MSAYYDVLIVGGGHGGAQAAAALRQHKFGGTVAIVGDEPDLPYERPPLSKDYLSQEKSFARILIRPETFWREKDITMLLGRRVTSVDPDLHSVTCEDGAVFRYGSLVWAAGGKPRRLACSGHDLTGVHGVRTRADVDQMMSELPGVERVVIVGGGYIGLEAAAALVKLGKKLTLLEAMSRVLARVAGAPLSRFYEAEHRAHGVEIRLDAVVACIEEKDGAACGVRMADGELIPCEMVIVGIGIIPSVAPLIEAGADGANGISVDRFCRSSLPDIYAIGDCAAHENGFAEGSRLRLESVQNANDQAVTVAKLITGTAEPYRSVPWFWSNQYDLRLQTVGLSTGHDDCVVRGDMASRSFSIVYLKSGRVIALDCVNATRDYVQGRALVTGGLSIARETLGDTRVALKEMG